MADPQREGAMSNDNAALEWVRAQPGGRVEIAVSELARQWGWDRSKLRRRLDSWAAAGVITRVVTSSGKSIISLMDTTTSETDTVAMSTEMAVPTPLIASRLTAPLSRPDPSTVSRQGGAVGTLVRRNFLSNSVFLLGVSAALVGLGLNTSFLWSFGRTPEAGVLLASIGLVIDGATLILPSAVAGLFSRRCYVLVVFSTLLCVFAWTMTIFVSIGFSTANIGDTVTERGGALSQRASIVEAMERLTAERNRLPPFVPTSKEGVAAAQDAVALAIITRDQACSRVGRTCRRGEAELGARQSEVMLAEKDKATTDQAARLDQRLREAQVALNALPVLGSADPQIEGAIDFIVWVSGAKIVPTPADLRMLRIFGLAVLPLLAGLFFPFAVALRQP